MRPTRALRSRIGRLIALGLAFEAVGAGAADEPSGPRPNILFAIADDWSWPHAGAYGDAVVETPTFDRVSAEGVLFTRAFCASPSCTPSRGAILTGQAVHRLGPGGNLWSLLPSDLAVYPDLLEDAGYVVGLQGKGWAPGTLEGSGRTRNPAGPSFKGFDEFLATVPADKPFCFWYGSSDPHRPYTPGSGREAGLDPRDVDVPTFLPDTPEIRADITDYYAEVQRFDRGVGAILRQIEASGWLENTLVVVTSDNGMPFPRAKANLYDSGTRMPLAIMWPGRVAGGRTSDAFVSLTDMAPTFLEAAGLAVPDAMTGRSLRAHLVDGGPAPRDRVYPERERHANVREGDLSYPSRAVRTADHLYIRNLRPDRWPAGDPEMYRVVGPFGDIDGSPSKTLILDRRDDPAIARFFRLACARRPAEELYDLANDPDQVENVAGRPEHADALATLRADLDRQMRVTSDPWALGETDRWDRYPYLGRQSEPRAKARPSGAKP